MQARRNALLLLHLVVFIWGFTGILGKLIEQSTLHLVYTRTVIGMVGLAVASRGGDEAACPLATPDLKHYLLTGLIITGHWITFYPRHQDQHGQSGGGLPQHQHGVHRAAGAHLVQAAHQDLRGGARLW
jgi:hypothetical protein